MKIITLITDFKTENKSVEVVFKTFISYGPLWSYFNGVDAHGWMVGFGLAVKYQWAPHLLNLCFPVSDVSLGRLHQKPCSTYESASLRMFRLGRTDTIRSASTDSSNFAKAFDDPGKKVWSFKAHTYCLNLEIYIFLRNLKKTRLIWIDAYRWCNCTHYCYCNATVRDATVLSYYIIGPS